MREFVLVLGMLISGTINTLSKKAQLNTASEGLDHIRHKFSKPWFQTLVMFMGEFLCLFAVMLLWLYQRNKRKQNVVDSERQRLIPSTGTGINADTDSHDSHDENVKAESVNSAAVEPSKPKSILEEEIREVNIFLFLIPAILDLSGTTLSGIGLLYTSASIYQMLRGSVVVFTSILSIIVLKRKLTAEQYSGVGIVVIGLALVGASSVLQQHNDSSTGDSDAVYYSVLGIAFNIAGQFCNAIQFIIEEKFLKGKNVHPLQVVGFEGMWGTLMMLAIALPVVHLIPGSDEGSYENTLDSLTMIYNSGLLFFLVILYWLSIAFFNFFSLSVTSKLSSLHRTLIDSSRTVIVWIIGLIMYLVPVLRENDYGEAWTNYSFIELGGFVLVLIGTLTYRGVIPLGKCFSKIGARIRGRNNQTDAEDSKA